MYSARLRQLPLSVDVLSPDVFDCRPLMVGKSHTPRKVCRLEVNAWHSEHYVSRQDNISFVILWLF